jgi:cytochrome c553
MRTRIVLGALTALVVAGLPVKAAQDTPDPTRVREFAAKLNVCVACHGANGVPKAGNIPIIFGQQENYLSKQLHDFKTGERNFEIMKWMSETFTEQETAPAAAYVAKQKWPAKATTVAATAAPRGIAVCQSCHAANYMGAVQAEGMTTPRLAGQNYDYLVEAMRRFADGERTNNADMVQIMKGISPADRDAMAKYLSAL